MAGYLDHSGGKSKDESELALAGRLRLWFFDVSRACSASVLYDDKSRQVLSYLACSKDDR